MKLTFEALKARTIIDSNGCWIWQRGKTAKGYPSIYADGQSGLRGHCVMFELVNGPIPSGIQVCHSCDRPPCINPEHLFLGTNQDNVDDSVRKGRRSHHSRKLSDTQALDIWQRKGESAVELATKHGCTDPTVYLIWKGKIYRDVTGAPPPPSGWRARG